MNNYVEAFQLYDILARPRMGQTDRIKLCSDEEFDKAEELLKKCIIAITIINTKAYYIPMSIFKNSKCSYDTYCKWFELQMFNNDKTLLTEEEFNILYEVFKNEANNRN